MMVRWKPPTKKMSCAANEHFHAYLRGQLRDLLFDASGKLVETEEETPLSAVPPAVKTALEARGKVLKVETLTKGSTVTYEAQVEKNGKKSEVEVDANGKTPKK